MTEDTHDIRLKKKTVYKPADSTSTGKGAAVARGSARRPRPAPPRARQVEPEIDQDMAWIQDTLKAAQYVGDVLTRRDQYFNKVLSLKRKFAAGKERDYAASIELLCERLRSHPLQAMLRDVMRDDPQLKKIRFFR